MVIIPIPTIYIYIEYVYVHRYIYIYVLHDVLFLADQRLLDFHAPSLSEDWVRVRRDGRICARTFEQTSFGRELLQ